MTHLLPELSVVEAEALELVLVDGAHHLHVDRRQRRLLFGELGVEVQHVLATLLQGKRVETIDKMWVQPNRAVKYDVHLAPRQGCETGRSLQPFLLHE